MLVLIGLLVAGTATAETVIVKYRGQVDLKDFKCAWPQSSFVHRVCYRENHKYLVVLLQQTYYHYCRIPPGVVADWLSAPSVGKYYEQYIKGNYDCRLGGIPQD